LTGGVYQVTGVAPSISPSMDIQVSSNFERALFTAMEGDAAGVTALMDGLRQSGAFTIPPAALERLRAAYASGRVSEDETLATIRRIHAATGRLICPHSAVAVAVAEAQA